jgi:transcriptional regulator with XRE-family HTH domain
MIAPHLGPALHHLRRGRGLTQTAVAEAAGLGKNLISNWETGVTYPSLSKLDKILAGALDADLPALHNALLLLNGKSAENFARAAELMVELALVLYAQGILPLGKAGELAGMSRVEFGLLVGRRGIPGQYGEEELAQDRRYARGEP